MSAGRKRAKRDQVAAELADLKLLLHLAALFLGEALGLEALVALGLLVRELLVYLASAVDVKRPRIWRISPYIDGQSSPFSLSQEEGFKDFAHMWSMDKPTIELLLVKARGVVEKQIGPSEGDLRRQDEVWKKEILDIFVSNFLHSTTQVFLLLPDGGG